MYVMTQGPKPRRLLQKAVFSVLSVGVVVGGVVLARQHFAANTQISDAPPAVTTKVLAAEASAKPFNAGPFTFNLPKDWEPVRLPGLPNSAISWQNTAKNKGMQTLTAYVDGLPPGAPLAFNRVLAVEAAGDRVQQLGDVSDNCVDFVEGSRNPSGSNGKVMARWNGVQFLCDNANFNRNVVGLSSANAVNGVTLTGSSGTHQILMVFTDANFSPKHDIFTSAVESLRLK